MYSIENTIRIIVVLIFCRHRSDRPKIGLVHVLDCLGIFFPAPWKKKVQEKKSKEPGSTKSENSGLPGVLCVMD